MTDFHVLVPKATTNLITNPSFENNADGWNAVGSTLTRVLTRTRFDRYSMQVVTNGAALNEGVYFRIDATGIDNAMSGSIYVRGAGRVRLRLFDGFKGEVAVSDPVPLNDDRWQRIEVVGQVGNSNDYRLYIETVGLEATTFYIDGAMIEQGDEVTTYCDGTLDGCRWNGVSHASTSSREAEEMTGGVWTPIRDKTCNPDIYVTIFSGTGMPPININRQRTALAPGSVFDNTTVDERVILLTIWVKDEEAQNRAGRGQLRIKELRQTLMDLVKPDVNPDTRPFMLRVTDEAGVAMHIPCRYEGGLEFDSDVRDKWKNTIPLRLLCLDPFFEEDGQEVAILDTENPNPDMNMLGARVDGEWQIVAQNFPGTGGDRIRAIEEDADGRIYIGGEFDTDADGNFLWNVARLNDDYSRMERVANGLVPEDIRDIKAHPNGKIYICGDFTQDSLGNPFNRIVEYDPVANTFAALGAGLNGDAHSIAIAPDGDLYVGGGFTTAGGVACFGIAKWDGGVWERVGDLAGDLAITSGGAFTIVMRDTDDIFAGGAWGTAGPENYYNIHFDGTNWTDMGDSETNQGNPTQYMLLASDGLLYIGASGFSEGIHIWNGSSYVSMGEGVSRTPGIGDPSVSYIAEAPDGRIYVSGSFELASGLQITNSVAIWNGSSWSQIDARWLGFNAGQTFATKIYIRANEDIYLGMDPRMVNYESSGITLVENISTTDVFPVISFTGTGRIYWLENQTTGQVVFWDYVLQEDEILTVDFREGLKVTSNYRGEVPDAILPSSDNFFLAAGKLDEPRLNKIALFISDEVEPTVQLRYTPVHWSIDAGAN